MNTQFDNLKFSNANSSHLAGKESLQQKDESDWGMHGRYDKYTLLNAYGKNIYYECSKIEFWKGGLKASFRIRQLSRSDKTKYYRFYKGLDHNMDEHIQLKDTIEGLMKNGRLYEYMKRGKRERVESPKSKSPSKFKDDGTSGEDRETIKGKRLYIIAITKEEPR